MTRPAAPAERTLTKQVRPDGKEVWATEQGEVHSVVRAPGVVVVTVIGHSDHRTQPLMTRHVEEEILAGRKVSWYGDYEKLTSFDLDVRADLARFTKDHRKDFDVVGIFVRSKFIALGVTIANLMVGGFIKVFRSRMDFERAVEATAEARATSARTGAR